MQNNGTPSKVSTPSKKNEGKKQKRTPAKSPAKASLKSPAKSPAVPQQQKKKQKKEEPKENEQVVKEAKELKKTKKDVEVAPSPNTSEKKKNKGKKNKTEKMAAPSSNANEDGKNKKNKNKKKEEGAKQEEKSAKKRKLEELKQKKEDSEDDEDEDEDEDELISMLTSKDGDESSSDEGDGELEKVEKTTKTLTDDKASAKKRKTEKSESKTTSSAFAVDVYNVNASVSEQHLEIALKDENLPFVSVTKSKFDQAKIYVSSKEDVEKYITKRTLELQKTKLVFGVDKKEDNQIMIHNLSPEITKDILMPYMKDIAQGHGVTVEKIDIFPTQMIQGRAAAYIMFSGPVPKATEFHKAKIQGKPVDVMFVSETDKKVMIRSLHKTITEADLMEYVQEAGEVDYLYIITNEDGESTQRAVVCYKNIPATREILDYSGADIQGKPVRIELVRDEELAKKSRARGGKM